MKIKRLILVCANTGKTLANSPLSDGPTKEHCLKELEKSFFIPNVKENRNCVDSVGVMMLTVSPKKARKKN